MSFQLVRQNRYQLPPTRQAVILPQNQQYIEDFDNFDNLPGPPMILRSDTEELPLDFINEEDEKRLLQDIDSDSESNEADNDQEECPICMRPYNERGRVKYTLTTCEKAHPMCRSCAVQIVNKAIRSRDTPRCPMCRAEFRGIENQENKTFSFYKKSSKNHSFGSFKKSKRTVQSSRVLARRSRQRSPRKTVSRKYKNI
jgi:hypothetical protein